MFGRLIEDVCRPVGQSVGSFQSSAFEYIVESLKASSLLTLFCVSSA